jgi:hypothetical protein
MDNKADIKFRKYFEKIRRKSLLKSSVADPDPHGSAFTLVGWIRIRIGNTNTDPDPDPGRAKMTHKSEENSS